MPLKGRSTHHSIGTTWSLGGWGLRHHPHPLNQNLRREAQRAVFSRALQVMRTHTKVREAAVWVITKMTSR